MSKTTIYTIGGECPPCTKAKHVLDGFGIEYDEIILSPTEAEYMVIPQTVWPDETQTTGYQPHHYRRDASAWKGHKG